MMIQKRRPGGLGFVGAFAIVVIVAIFSIGIAGFVLNNPGATQARAQDGALNWMKTNGIEAKRISCSYDADADGYGSCTIVTHENERVFLQCVSDFVAQAFGATGCKEVETVMKIGVGK